MSDALHETTPDAAGQLHDVPITDAVQSVSHAQPD